jgi:UDP-N-acetylmuramyl tripeptide synthase
MDSRLVKPFSLFVAVSGTVVDGHEFITKAIESGATAIVCERLPENKNANITYIKVSNSAEALGYIASNYYDNPSEKIEVSCSNWNQRKNDNCYSATFLSLEKWVSKPDYFLL